MSRLPPRAPGIPPSASLLLLLMVALAVSTGCGGPPRGTVSGRVTYEGQAVESGAISFLPSDGKGPTVGTRVAAGEYRATGLLPGQKNVQIVAVKSVPFARSSQEMEQRANSATSRGDTSGLIDRADVIPPDAVGNNVNVEVRAGDQQLDFALTAPAASK